MLIITETIIVTLTVLGTIIVLNCASYTCLICTGLCCNCLIGKRKDTKVA